MVEFETVQIGNQFWATKNLNVDRFANGNLIPEAKTDEEWEAADTNHQPAWCHYQNDPVNEAKYGKLYNWYAVNDPSGLCPKGWHVPSNAEWIAITNYLGEFTTAGTALKSMYGWEGDGNGDNKSGFAGLPGGYRNYMGAFNYISKNGYWWSSTEFTSEEAWYRYLYHSSAKVFSSTNVDKGSGFSVRCVRD